MPNRATTEMPARSKFKSLATGQVMPVQVVKVQLDDGRGNVVEGYALVDDLEVRLIEKRSVTSPIPRWAAEVVRDKLKEQGESV